MPKIDFTDVGEPEEWTPAPTGDYTLQLIDTVDGETKSGDNKGNPNTQLKFEIVDCEGELEKYNGRTIYNYATYGEKGLPVLKKMLRAFGVDTEDGELEWDWEELIGLKIRARLRSVPSRPKQGSPGEFWPAKNEISRFIAEDDKE